MDSMLTILESSILSTRLSPDLAAIIVESWPRLPKSIRSDDPEACVGGAVSRLGEVLRHVVNVKQAMLIIKV